MPRATGEQAVAGEDRSRDCDFEGKGIEPLPFGRT
jgi:hypothetical protein